MHLSRFSAIVCRMILISITLSVTFSTETLFLHGLRVKWEKMCVIEGVFENYVIHKVGFNVNSLHQIFSSVCVMYKILEIKPNNLDFFLLPPTNNELLAEIKGIFFNKI